MSQFDLIVVGNGLAAQAVMAELAKDPDLQTKKILQVFDEKNHSACTFKTTGVVCLSGVQKGISSLGDLIFDSYYFTKNLFESEKLRGIYPAFSYQLCQDEKESRDDFVRRFGSVDSFDSLAGHKLKNVLYGKKWENFLIKPEEFIPALEKVYLQLLPNLEKSFF